MCYFPWDKKTFELIMAEIGFFLNHKGLFYYANGKSEVLRHVVELVKKSAIPEKDRLAVAIKIVDRKANGATPSWAWDLLSDDERYWMGRVMTWFKRVDEKNITAIYKRMGRASLDRYNYCIQQIDRVNGGRKYY